MLFGKREESTESKEVALISRKSFFFFSCCVPSVWVTEDGIVRDWTWLLLCSLEDDIISKWADASYFLLYCLFLVVVYQAVFSSFGTAVKNRSDLSKVHMTPCYSRFAAESTSKNMLLPLQMETVMLDWGSLQLSVKSVHLCLLWGLKGSAVKSPDRKLLKPVGTPHLSAKTSDITGILRTHKTQPDLSLRAVCETVKLLTVTCSTVLSRISSGANWAIYLFIFFVFFFRNSFTTGYKTADRFPILFPGSTVCQVSIIPTGLAGVNVFSHISLELLTMSWFHCSGCLLILLQFRLKLLH